MWIFQPFVQSNFDSPAARPESLVQLEVEWPPFRLPCRRLKHMSFLKICQERTFCGGLSGDVLRQFERAAQALASAGRERL